jgi:hypothetical protein
VIVQRFSLPISLAPLSDKLGYSRTQHTKAFAAGEGFGAYTQGSEYYLRSEK